MIKFENTQVFNFEGALRGMRNPLNSWDKSDSWECKEFCPHVMNNTVQALPCDNGDRGFCIGKNDLNLARRLIKGGSDHRKFMRQIFVSVDITAPLYWWKEFDTYKVGTVSNSCSTMHTIHREPFNETMFSWEHMIDTDGTDYIINTIESLNHFRENYLETKDNAYWYKIIQALPTSYNQKRTITLNYETLYSIYRQRRNHKLSEWSIGFTEWIETLPYAEELIICSI